MRLKNCRISSRYVAGKCRQQSLSSAYSYILRFTMLQ